MPGKYIKVAIRKKPGPKPGFAYNFGNKSDEEIAKLLRQNIEDWDKRIESDDFEYKIEFDLQLGLTSK